MHTYSVNITPRLEAKQALSADFIAQAAQAFQQEGVIILENAFEEAQVQQWHTAFMTLLQQKVAAFEQNAGGKVQGNHDVQRWNMHLPTQSILFDTLLLAHPVVVAVLKAVFQRDFAPVFIASDIAFPGSTNQEIHQDGGDFSIAVNIPLVDVSQANGATEVWVKTHLQQGVFSQASCELSPEAIQSMVQTYPNDFLTMKRGSLSMRDMRMLHRGTINHTQEPRPLISLIYMPTEAKAPHWQVTNFFVRQAKKMRQQAWKTGRQSLIDHANTLGRMCDIGAMSDRDYRRQIDAATYAQLSTDAKYLLRFADLAPAIKPDFEVARSWRTTWAMAKDLGLYMFDFYRKKWSSAN